GHAFEVTHRPYARVEVKHLAKRYIEASNPTADRSSQRALDRHDELRDRLNGFVGQPFAELVEGFFPREYLVPRNSALSAVRFFDCGVKHPPRRTPDIAARPVAFDERNDGAVGDFQLDAVQRNLLTIGGNFYTIEPHY